MFFAPKNTKSPPKSRTFVLGCKIVAPLWLPLPCSNQRHCGRRNSGCTAEVQGTSNRLLRCPEFPCLPAEIPTAATSSPRFIRHRRRFGSSPTDFARSVGEHKVVIGCIGWRSTRNKKKHHPDGWCFFLSYPNNFEPICDSKY